MLWLVVCLVQLYHSSAKRSRLVSLFFLQLWLSIYVTVSAWWPVGGVCSPIMPLRCETRCGSSQFFRDGFICANVTQLPLLKGTTHVRKLSNKCSKILIGIKVDMVCDIPSNDTIGRGLPFCKLYGSCICNATLVSQLWEACIRFVPKFEGSSTM